MNQDTPIRRGAVLLAIVLISGGARTGLSQAASGASAAQAPRQTPVDLVARWQDYEPYDGSGRYAMAKEDGVRGVQGLLALAGRFGVKPYKDLATGEGAWQTERVIFKDVDTGATMIRYTNDRWADQLSYFQGNWSADGRWIVFRRRPGMWESSTATHGPMAMGADGAGLRNVFRQYRMVRGEVCSPTEPNVCYGVADGDAKVVAFDIATGKQIRLVRQVARGWHMKISLDGKYLMNRAQTSKGKGLWIAGVDGKEFYEISVPEPIHDSYRFHPSQKKIMFWYEGKFYQEGFVQCDFDGSNLTKVNVPFDWNHGDVGPDRGVHCSGFMTRIQGDTWLPREMLFHAPGVEYYDDPHDYNGYTSWWPKDQPWSYNTRIVHRPNISEIQAFPAEPAADKVVNRYRVCFTALKRVQFLDNPNASPDGTKVLFNSNFLGSDDVFGVVARLPERPTELQAQPTASGVRLSWKPGRHHAETAGYHVYRSRTSGVGFVPLTTRPLQETSFTDEAPVAGGASYYAVTAIEHSGLESGLSDEACPARGKAGKRRLMIEAEQAQSSPELWVAFAGQASDLYYLWMRKKDVEGRATLALPRAARDLTAPIRLWARVKGPKGVEFHAQCGAGTLAIRSGASRSWNWVRADGELELGSSPTMSLSSRVYGSAIDCVCLTDDPEFTPGEAPRIAAAPLKSPEALTAAPISPYAVRLQWQPNRDAALSHYNVYCGTGVDFTADQTTLIASPDQARLVDWALKPGSTCYYRVSCVDRFGRESAVSPAAAARTPAIQPVMIEKEYAESMPLEVVAKDTYVVWLLLKKAGNSRGYIDVRCHRAPTTADAKPVSVAGGGSWTGAMDGLSDSSWFSYDQWGRFDLDASSYILKIANKSGNKIEKVVVTNDQSYTPPGHVNILTGW